MSEQDLFERFLEQREIWLSVSCLTDTIKE